MKPRPNTHGFRTWPSTLGIALLICVGIISLGAPVLVWISTW